VEQTTVARVPLWNNKKHDHGPFDIIGDVHGCLVELRTLLQKLGWDTACEPPTPPPGRKAVFVGDLVDRGPDSPGVLKLVMALVQNGSALCVPGNHEVKLLKFLSGKKVSLKHGLERTAQQLEAETEEWKASVARFVDGLVSHVVLDGGNLVVAHAGLKAEMQGRGSGAVRQFCLFGETTGETDEFGLPVRYNWAADYRGSATVVYGHTPVPEATWLNRTLCIDTGCVFGGKLTALRWPEKAIVSVPATAEHYPPTKPLLPAPRVDAVQALRSTKHRLSSAADAA
jgi:protein phosphatase